MNALNISLAIALTLAGSLCLYLASPNQSWLRKSLPTASSLGIGCSVILAAGWLWIQTFSTVAGIFTLLILVMLALTVYPYLSLLKTRRSVHDEHC